MQTNSRNMRKLIHRENVNVYGCLVTCTYITHTCSCICINICTHVNWHTHTDTERMVSILENILEKLGEGSMEEEGGEQVWEDLHHLQTMVDMMRSPLFSQLVQIRSQYEKVS